MSSHVNGRSGQEITTAIVGGSKSSSMHEFPYACCKGELTKRIIGLVTFLLCMWQKPEPECRQELWT